jgi:two-component system nitrate/nitrite response regulator NarL
MSATWRFRADDHDPIECARSHSAANFHDDVTTMAEDILETSRPTQKPKLALARSGIIELVLAESYPIMLEGMDHMFRSEPGFRVLACCKDGDEALRAVWRHRPDVLVLDLRIPGKSALEVLDKVAAGLEHTRVVLLAEGLAEDEMLEATRHGARGIVLKSMPSHLVVQCVRKVHQGTTWLERASVGRAVDMLLKQDASHRETAERLTLRELEILRMVVRGQSNKEIADKLAISQATVKAHLHHVYEKLGVKGRLELLFYARDKGLLWSLFRTEQTHHATN